MNPNNNNNNVFQSPHEAQRSTGGHHALPSSMAISIDAIAKRVAAYIAEGEARRANKAREIGWK